MSDKPRCESTNPNVVGVQCRLPAEHVDYPVNHVGDLGGILISWETKQGAQSD